MKDYLAPGKRLLLIVLGIALSFRPAQAEIGVSNYGAHRYIETITGDAPILILVPDEGTILPGADAKGSKSKNSKLLARRLIDEINLLTGRHSHAIFNHLDVAYLDVNSPIQNDSDKTRASALQKYIEAQAAAKESVKAANGVVVDLSHPEKNETSLVALLTDARKAEGTKVEYAVSTLAKGIISELNSKASMNLYSRVDEKINVGIFRVGTAMSNAAIYAMRIDPAIRSIGITTDQVDAGILKELDAIVLPGGGGTAQIKDLGPEGCKKVEAFVEGGGGYVGFCAGAYSGGQSEKGVSSSKLNLLSTFPDHKGKGWARGAAMTKMENTEAAAKLLPEYKGADIIYYAYNQGPLMGIRDVPEAENYVIIQRFITDVKHRKPEAEGIMPGKIALMMGDREKGKVVLASAHPEATPGMRWMAPRMIYWSLGKESVSYDPIYVRPELYSEEVMFDKERNSQSEVGMKMILDPSLSAPSRVRILKDVVRKTPRLFKKSANLEELLMNPEKQIRIATVEAMLELDYFESSLYLKEAYIYEKDEKVRTLIAEAINDLDVL